jgi:CzcA family heavy metal efflux pump
MLRWIVGTSLRLRFLVVLAAAMLIFLGVTQIRNLPVDVYPEFAPPKVEVQTLCLGLSAAEVEELVTVPMERVLNGLPGLDVLRSRSIADLSDIVLIFKPGINLMDARLRVQERVREASVVLPVWATSPFIIQPLSSTSRALKIGLSTKDKSTRNLINTALIAYWTIRPRLMRVPGVANVAIWGDRWSVINVQVHPERLQEHEVSLLSVMEAAADALDVGVLKFRSGANIGTGGVIDTPNQRLGIRHILPKLSSEEMAQIPLEVPRGREPVAIGDVATTVWDTQPHMNGDAIINDGLGIMMIVEKLPWGNTLDVTRGVEEALAEMRVGLPGIEIDTTIFRPATFIETAINNLTTAALIGAVLLVLVLVVFLYDWRIALISVVAIPVSLTAALLVLYQLGATIGDIVDDAIIDIENVVRRLRQHRREGSGKSLVSIILDASLEVRGAIVTATMIEVLAVLPVFLLEGLSGAFFKPLALAYGLALGVSMIVALTVTPALALILLSNAPLSERESPVVRWLQRGYEAVLSRVIRTPVPAYATIGVMVLAGLVVWPRLGHELLPDFKERDFLMHWVARPGTSQWEMNRIVTRVSKELRAIPGVRNFGSHIGQGTLADEPVGINFAENWISIDKSADYDKTRAAIQEVVDGYPGIYRDVQTYLRERIKEVLTGTSEAIVVRISGDDHGVLLQKAEEVKALMAGIEGIIELHIDHQLQVPLIQIEVDLAPAMRYGIKPGDVRRAAGAFIASEETGDIWRDGKNTEVHVWSMPEARRSFEPVRNLLMDARDGRRVRLGDLARVELVPTQNVVLREASSRRMHIAANVSGRDLGSVARDVQERLKKVSFPLGYHAEMLGEFQERQAAQGRMLLISVVSAIGIFLLLQASFGNWRLTTLSFVTLPTSLVGGVVAAYVGGGNISLGSLVGFLTVLGINARNGIMLIEHYQHLERYEGETFGPGLVLRGARERISPITMTALTTFVAILPLVVAGNIAGNEIEHPMAVVIMGGFLTSMLLNLFVVPCLYLRFGASRKHRPSGLQYG